MDFFQYDHGFCELKLYGAPPEYINSITSLFISYMGFFGMKNNNHLNNDIFLLYAALFVNGFVSCAYHWTNYLGFGLLDRFSMILIAYPALSSCFKEVAYLYNMNSTNKKYFIICKQIYFTILITLCAYGYEESFNALFGIFLGGNIIFIWLFYKKKSILSIKTNNLLFNSFIGLLLMLFAGISWITVEKLCDRFYIMKFIQGHAFWHIGVSIGGYLISLLVVSLSIERKYQLPRYNISTKSINYK
jgi:hypothetical protein